MSVSQDPSLSPSARRRVRAAEDNAYTQALRAHNRGRGEHPGPARGQPGYDPALFMEGTAAAAEPPAPLAVGAPAPQQGHGPHQGAAGTQPGATRRAGYAAPGARLPARPAAGVVDPGAPGGNPALGTSFPTGHGAPPAPSPAEIPHQRAALGVSPAARAVSGPGPHGAQPPVQRGLTPMQSRAAGDVRRPVPTQPPEHLRGGLSNLNTGPPVRPAPPPLGPPAPRPGELSVGGLGPGGGSPIRTGIEAMAPPEPPSTPAPQAGSGGMMGGAEQFMRDAPPHPAARATEAAPLPPGASDLVNREPAPAAEPAVGLMRVGIVGPHFMFGEHERFFRDLMLYADPQRIKWEVLCATSPELFVPHPEIAHAGAEPVGGQGGATLAAERSDLVIVWGGIVPPDPGDSTVFEFQADLIEAACDQNRLVPQRARELVRKEMRVTPEQRVVACFGDLITRNNPWAVIQAIKALNHERGDGDPEYVGVLIGEGNNVPEIRQYSDRLLRQDGPVRFLGGRTDIGDLLAAVDVVLAPAVGRSAGHSVLDALAVGVPVVATPVGVAADPAIKDAIILVPRAIENADGPIPPMQLEQEELAERIGTAYAEAIAEVFDDRDATAVREERGRELILSHYSPQAWGKRWTRELLLRAGFPLPPETEGPAPE